MESLRLLRKTAETCTRSCSTCGKISYQILIRLTYYLCIAGQIASGSTNAHYQDLIDVRGRGSDDGHIWIGNRRKYNDSSGYSYTNDWLWSDGSPNIDNNWYVNHPRNASDNNRFDCVYMHKASDEMVSETCAKYDFNAICCIHSKIIIYILIIKKRGYKLSCLSVTLFFFARKGGCVCGLSHLFIN